MRHCWMQITSGNGPAECRRAVAHVFKEIQKEAANNQVTVELIDAQKCPEQPNAYHSILLKITGANAQQFCQSWHGTIQWIWKSRFRPKHKRKNWFTACNMLTEQVREIQWLEKDLRFDLCRASGPGGQHVNTTDSMVRVTHLPTGISVTASEERSQHMNKKLALARLDAAFKEKTAQKKEAAKKTQWQNHNQLERGNSIRTFQGDHFKPVKNKNTPANQESQENNRRDSIE